MQRNLYHRGGTIVFVKNCLSQYMSSVDLGVDDQVWLRLECAPNILFGFCYVPPTDSPYFSHYSFAAILERIVDSENSKVMIMGDMNAKFGAGVRDILRSEYPVPAIFAYPSIPGEVTSPNDNAYILATMCKGNDLLFLTI